MRVLQLNQQISSLDDLEGKLMESSGENGESGEKNATSGKADGELQYTYLISFGDGYRE